MFEKRGFREIYESMATDLRRRRPELTDYEVGSVVRSLFESFAVEMATLYEQMDLVYQAGFVDTATGANLDRVVAVLGITRNEPDFATGEVTFERDPGSEDEIVIPVGTLVTTEEDPEAKPSKKAYLTTEEDRIGGGQTTAEVKVQAVERGPLMISDSETVVVMPRPVPGVKRVTNRKPIRFLGRERETDEALRDRAKKALLASGRASAISIENSLLGMPGVRGVQIREVPPRPEGAPATGGTHDGTGPGVVEVFVDGMTSDNAADLRRRIDEVRAAGIYVIVAPARAIQVQATLRIVPAGNPSPDDRAALEREVHDVVYHFIDRIRMGQPLLFSQLTREVLNVKGVADLADFRLVTFREMPARGVPREESRALGEVTLRRPEETLDQTLAVPTRLALRTRQRQYFEVTAVDARFEPGSAELAVPVRSLADGRDGELLRTGSAVEWEGVEVDGKRLTVSNREPIRLKREVYLPDARRIEASLEDRFVPDRVRVASEEKALAVHVLVELSFPNEAMRDELAAALQARFDAVVGTLSPGEATGLKLARADLDAVKATLEAFKGTMRQASARLAQRVVVVPDDDTLLALQQAVRDYFAERAPDAIEALVLEERLRALLGGALGEAAEGKLRPPLRAQLEGSLRDFGQEQLGDFPAAELAERLREGVRRRFRAELARIETRAKALADTMGTQRVTLAQASMTAARATGGEVAAAQKALEDAQKALAASESSQRDIDAERQALARQEADDSARVDALVEAMRRAAETQLQALAAPESLDEVLAGKSVSGSARLGVRLRTVTFEREVRADVPRVEPSFVETAEPDPIFVYSRLLPLGGRLALTLPITAVEEEKRGVREAVRQRVAEYLDGLGPEEKVELDRIRALADEHDQVLRAAFEIAPELRAEKGRVSAGKLNVKPFEKVVLGDEGLFQIVA